MWRDSDANTAPIIDFEFNLILSSQMNIRIHRKTDAVLTPITLPGLMQNAYTGEL